MTAGSHPDSERAKRLETRFSSVLGERNLLESDIINSQGMAVLRVASENLLKVLTFLRDDPECLFVNFTDLCGVDYPERQKRFEVVYHLLSPYKNCRVRVITTTDESTPIPSIESVFPGAGWYEREAYDLYGILFSGHGDLRRILTDYGFDGYPLRKDFPLTGFVEVRYDPTLRRVINQPVALQQEFRSFDFLSPWEGQSLLPSQEGE
jgi:NADH-quinone oxidoreductase subunit C